MAKRRKRRKNPEYSDAVAELTIDFVEALDKASNLGYKIARKIDTKSGYSRVGTMIEKMAERLRDMSEELEDELGN